MGFLEAGLRTSLRESEAGPEAGPEAGSEAGSGPGSGPGSVPGLDLIVYSRLIGSYGRLTVYLRIIHQISLK